MSELKVNKISPRSGTTVTLGDSGDTFTIPSGATINNQGTATNFGATGSASWTTTVKTSGFTAVAGEGYFVNTTGGAVSVNLPAGVAGDVVAIKDYAGTFDTNAVTLVQNGSDKIGGSAINATINTEGIAATLIFIDSTQGWLVTDDGLQSSLKQPYPVDFLCIAGGGGGGSRIGGGGGAGGYRNSYNSEASGGGGSSETALQLSPGTAYTISVGNGGPGAASGTGANGGGGNDSSISGTGITTITSIGGGFGTGYSGAPGLNPGGAAGSGGSGGGAGARSPANTVGAGTANQGFAGGLGTTGDASGGGGGGASAVGTGGGNNNPGGNGLASSITGSAVTRAGGGGAGVYTPAGGSAGSGGTGGGGAGAENANNATNGTANTGGGGGGGGDTGASSGTGGTGGSGVIILRMATANYSGTTTGSPTVTTSGSDTILVFNGSGSYTA